MIGDKIRMGRENKGLSREHFAALLEMDVRTYEKIEHNKRDLQLMEVQKIADALELTPSELLFGEPKLVFENCTQNVSLYNSGTVNNQNIETLKSIYDELIMVLKQEIADKNKIIELLQNKQ